MSPHSTPRAGTCFATETSTVPTFPRNVARGAQPAYDRDRVPVTTMQLPSRASVFVSVAPLLVVGVMSTAAVVSALPRIALLHELARTTRATLAAPHAGPAIYAGSVEGPHDRVTIGGERAALTYWWVDRSENGARRPSCAGGEHDGLVLRDGQRDAAISFLRAGALPVLRGNSGDNPWASSTVIDLASTFAVAHDAVPADLANCSGRDSHYYEHRIAGGTHVEVVGCVRDGAIHACPGRLAGVLVVGSVIDHRWRRAFDLRSDLRFVIVLGLASVVAAVGYTLAFAARSTPWVAGAVRKPR